LVGRLVSHGEVTRTSRCLFSFFTWARPFPTLPAGHPKNSFKFWAVGQSVSRSVKGSHTNITLPLQFRHPGQPFPTLLCPAAHPENSLQFWLVGWSIGHREVTRTSLCLFSFVTLPRPSRPFYALQATPKTALNFGWLVDWTVGHGEVTQTSCYLFSFST
jgi:hypothetical protein